MRKKSPLVEAPHFRVATTPADVGGIRETNRQRRLRRLGAFLWIYLIWMLWRGFSGRPVHFGFPEMGPEFKLMLPAFILFFLIGVMMMLPLASARSPHIRFRPEQIDTGFKDVVGVGHVLEEVQQTLDIFRTYRAFREELGGNPRRGVLFEGPPGTGKTHLAKAMAREAGVPFFYVSAPAFQTMWYGMSAWKIRNFFRNLKRAARKEGGAIGFIEEIDAIGATRGGVEATSSRPGDPRVSAMSPSSGTTSGMVNELLIQLQSFDSPPMGRMMIGQLIDGINLFLSPRRQLGKPRSPYSNVLVIAATNRSQVLDPALLRPGRFDRILSFDPPTRDGRRALIKYFLDKRAHDPDMDASKRHDELAGVTFGYTPAMLQHLFDEALVWALRDGRRALTSADIHKARLSSEIGLPQPSSYEEDERRLIATHEAGHAVAAHLCCPKRRLEVLTIIKRRAALGLLAHTETEERHTASKSELTGLLRVAFAGMAAEEIFFGESTTGPASDLAHATQLAAQMVGSYGMHGTLLSFDAMTPGPFSTSIVDRVLADSEGRKCVEECLQHEKAEVKILIEGHRHLVEALRDSLLEREELVGDEITDVLKAAGSPRKIFNRTKSSSAT